MFDIHNISRMSLLALISGEMEAAMFFKQHETLGLAYTKKQKNI